MNCEHEPLGELALGAPYSVMLSAANREWLELPHAWDAQRIASEYPCSAEGVRQALVDEGGDEQRVRELLRLSCQYAVSIDAVKEVERAFKSTSEALAAFDGIDYDGSHESIKSSYDKRAERFDAMCGMPTTVLVPNGHRGDSITAALRAPATFTPIKEAADRAVVRKPGDQDKLDKSRARLSDDMPERVKSAAAWMWDRFNERYAEDKD